MKNVKFKIISIFCAFSLLGVLATSANAMEKGDNGNKENFSNINSNINENCINQLHDDFEGEPFNFKKEGFFNERNDDADNKSNDDKDYDRLENNKLFDYLGITDKYISYEDYGDIEEDYKKEDDKKIEGNKEVEDVKEDNKGFNYSNFETKDGLNKISNNETDKNFVSENNEAKVVDVGELLKLKDKKIEDIVSYIPKENRINMNNNFKNSNKNDSLYDEGNFNKSDIIQNKNDANIKDIGKKPIVYRDYTDYIEKFKNLSTALENMIYNETYDKIESLREDYNDLRCGYDVFLNLKECSDDLNKEYSIQLIMNGIDNMIDVIYLNVDFKYFENKIQKILNYLDDVISVKNGLNIEGFGVVKRYYNGLYCQYKKYAENNYELIGKYKKYDCFKKNIFKIIALKKNIFIMFDDAESKINTIEAIEKTILKKRSSSIEAINKKPLNINEDSLNKRANSVEKISNIKPNKNNINDIKSEFNIDEINFNVDSYEDMEKKFAFYLNEFQNVLKYFDDILSLRECFDKKIYKDKKVYFKELRNDYFEYFKNNQNTICGYKKFSDLKFKIFKIIDDVKIKINDIYLKYDDIKKAINKNNFTSYGNSYNNFCNKYDFYTDTDENDDFYTNTNKNEIKVDDAHINLKSKNFNKNNYNKNSKYTNNSIYMKNNFCNKYDFYTDTDENDDFYPSINENEIKGNDSHVDLKNKNFNKNNYNKNSKYTNNSSYMKNNFTSYGNSYNDFCDKYDFYTNTNKNEIKGDDSYINLKNKNFNKNNYKHNFKYKNYKYNGRHYFK